MGLSPFVLPVNAPPVVSLPSVPQAISVVGGALKGLAWIPPAPSILQQLQCGTSDAIAAGQSIQVDVVSINLATLVPTVLATAILDAAHPSQTVLLALSVDPTVVIELKFTPIAGLVGAHSCFGTLTGQIG